MKTSPDASQIVNSVQEHQMTPPLTGKDSLTPRLRRILESVTLSLSQVAQSHVKEMKLDNDRDRAIAYVRVVSKLISKMSAMMSELDEACQEVYTGVSGKDEDDLRA